MRRKSSHPFAAPACAACGYKAATTSIAICPGCGRSFVPEQSTKPRRKIGWFASPPMRYPTAYKWFVLISALDVVLTWFILLLGGREVNILADAVIAAGGLKGILIYKFCLVVLVIVICEVVGRRRPILGRALSLGALAVTAIPVALSIAQLLGRIVL